MASDLTRSKILRVFLFASGLLVAGVMIWQGVAASGAPNPLAPGTGFSAAVLDIAVLVFREGLECVLVLAAITAGAGERGSSLRSPVALGAAAGFLATLATWFAAVHILNDLSQNVSALALQAATGLLAVAVLLVVMNWFFHKVYWTGWISTHNRRKRALLERVDLRQTSRRAFFLGMVSLGFTSFYREGFEVVLFLQSYRLKLGNTVVAEGVAIGLFLAGTVAALTFLAHKRLPYRRMLVLTGILLGVVLIVMVGEQVQEMQLAHWLPTTEIPGIAGFIPPWLGLWFSVFPNVETLAGQAVAAIMVLGSYFLANRKPARASARPIRIPAAAGATYPLEDKPSRNTHEPNGFASQT
jgi:high-affinity iron transporter